MSANYQQNIELVKRTVKALLLTLVLSLSFVISTHAANRTYGPVKPNDYLSKIVNRSYPDSTLSKDQIMVAILRANPESFRGGNIHFLRQAVTLTLPDDSQIASIPAKEASAVVAEHLVFFKQGITGNVINKPLAQPVGTDVASDSSSQPAEGSEPAEGSQTAEGSEPAEGSQTAEGSQPEGTTISEIPSKIRIKVRKEKQEKENNYKHVIALEKISNQQNKALRTLDEHIRLLEDQLKIDNQEDKTKAATVPVPSPNDVSEENADSGKESDSGKEPDSSKKSDADELATNAISSLEKKLSKEDEARELGKVNKAAKDEFGKEADQVQIATVEPEKVEPETIVNDVQQTQDNVSVQDNAAEADVVDTKSALDTNDAIAFENSHSEVLQPVSQESSASFVSTLKSMDKGKLFSLIGAFVLGLFTLSYFIFGRNAQQKSSAVTTPLHKEKFEETVGSPLTIPDADILLNPVIRTKVDASSVKSSVNSSDTSDQQSTTSTDSNLNNEADSDTQDAELKINMARAYMDMNYIDASKEILNEVILEGSKEQKETAQQMLSML